MIRITLAVASILATLGATAAQDLPSACTTGASGNGADHGVMAAPMAPAGDTAREALMAGMDRMNADMMRGGMAADIDVAFVCAMIPHHRGAIDMAKAIIAHGDDPWVKALAEQVVAAQEKEIADMEEWLAAQAN